MKNLKEKITIIIFILLKMIAKNVSQQMRWNVITR